MHLRAGDAHREPRRSARWTPRSRDRRASAPPASAGSLSEAHTGGGAVTHQWGYRTTSGGAITDIPFATSPSYVLNGADFPAAGQLLPGGQGHCRLRRARDLRRGARDRRQHGGARRRGAVLHRHLARLAQRAGVGLPGGLQHGPHPLHHGLALRLSRPTATTLGHAARRPGRAPPGARDKLRARPGSERHDLLLHDLRGQRAAAPGRRAARTRACRSRPRGPLKWAFRSGHVLDHRPHRRRRPGSSPPTTPTPCTRWRAGPPAASGRPAGSPLHARRRRAEPLADRADHGRRREPRRVPGRAGRQRLRRRRHDWAAPRLRPGRRPRRRAAVVQAAPAGLFTAFGGAFDYLLVGTREAGADNVLQGARPRQRQPARRPSTTAAAPTRDRHHQRHGRRRLRHEPRLLHEPRARRGQREHALVPAARADAERLHPGRGRATTSGDIESAPVLRGGRVYVGSTNGGGTLYSIDAATGSSADDRTFVHGDGPVKGFVFPDRNSPTGDLYFAANTRVWGVDRDRRGARQQVRRPASPLLGRRRAVDAAVPRRRATTSTSAAATAGSTRSTLAAAPVAESGRSSGDAPLTVGAPVARRATASSTSGPRPGTFFAVEVPLPGRAALVREQLRSVRPNGTPCTLLRREPVHGLRVASPVSCYGRRRLLSREQPLLDPVDDEQVRLARRPCRRGSTRTRAACRRARTSGSRRRWARW